MQVPGLNPDTITDLAAMRAVVVQLLNLIEAQASDITALRAANQQLHDVLARLKGGSGKPDLKPSVKPAAHDHSSEAERRTRTPRSKPKKNEPLIVTHEERCVVDPATLLSDAVRHGTTDSIVQCLRINVEVVRFVRELWYVPSANTTLTAPLPPGYRGGFCPTIQSIIPALGHGANVSQPALLRFLRDIGLTIGTGTVARMLCWTRREAGRIKRRTCIAQVPLPGRGSQQTRPAPAWMDRTKSAMWLAMAGSRAIIPVPAARARMSWQCCGAGAP